MNPVSSCASLEFQAAVASDSSGQTEQGIV